MLLSQKDALYPCFRQHHQVFHPKGRTFASTSTSLIAFTSLVTMSGSGLYHYQCNGNSMSSPDLLSLDEESGWS